MLLRLRNFFLSATPKQLFLFNLVVATLLFLFTKYVIGNYYEVYEAIPPTMLSGKLMDGVPANIIYPIASVLLSDLYVRLYALWPNVVWYDYFMAGYMILAVAVIFTAIHLRLRDKLSLPKIILVNAAIFFLFIADNILNWNYTRTSFTVCIAAFIWFAILMPQKFSRQMIVPYLLTALLFLLGVLIRPEAGQLMFLLIGFYLFCRMGFRKELFVKLLPFFIPVLLVSGSILYDRKTTNQFYIQLDPAVEFAIALDKVVPISEMKTTIDSMKYVALKQGIVNDPHYITNAFMHGVVSKNALLFFNNALLRRARDTLCENIKTRWQTASFGVLLFLIGLFYLLPWKRKAFAFVCYSGFFWIMLFGVAYFLTLETRLTAPLLFFYAAANMIFLFENNFLFAMSGSFFKRTLLVGFCITTIAVLFQLGGTRKDYEKSIAENHRTFKALEQIGRNKVLVPDASACMIIFFNNYLPFHTPDFRAFKGILMVDMEAMTLAPAYQAYLKKHCSCQTDDLGALFGYFYSIKGEVVFAGTPERMALFQSYLQIVHGKSFSFQHFADLPAEQGIEDKGLENVNRVSVFTID
jgi:hypothetical protein